MNPHPKYSNENIHILAKSSSTEVIRQLEANPALASFPEIRAKLHQDSSTHDSTLKQYKSHLRDLIKHLKLKEPWQFLDEEQFIPLDP